MIRGIPPGDPDKVSSLILKQKIVISICMKNPAMITRSQHSLHNNLRPLCY